MASSSSQDVTATNEAVLPESTTDGALPDQVTTDESPTDEVFHDTPYLDISSNTTNADNGTQQSDECQSIAPGLSGRTDSNTSPTYHDSFVRVCPHITLSYDQYYQFAHTKFPMSETDEGLEITASITSRHGRIPTETYSYRTHEQFPDPHYIPPKPSYQLIKEVSFADNPDTREGFTLCAFWEVILHASDPGNYHKNDVRSLLEDSNVWLCQHTKIWDDWVVDALCCLVRIEEEYYERYNEREKRGDMHTHCMVCEKCDTTIRVGSLTDASATVTKASCIVMVKRFLGTGWDGEEDNEWMRQSLKREEDKGDGSNLGNDPDFNCKMVYIRGYIDQARKNMALRRVNKMKARIVPGHDVRSLAAASDRDGTPVSNILSHHDEDTEMIDRGRKSSSSSPVS